MAVKRALKLLRMFYKEQEKDRKQAAIPEDEQVIEEIINEPNPGVARAKRHGITITVAEGNTIYKISADNTKQKVGTVSSKDVTLSERRFSVH